MERNRPKFRLRLNLFDTIVLILAVLAALFLLWWSMRSSSAPGAGSDAAATVRYTVRFQRWGVGDEEIIHLDDSVSDNIKNYEMGRVVSVQAVPSEILVLDREKRAFVRAELEGFEDVLVTLESACTVSDGAVTVGGDYEVRVGSIGYCRGEGYMGSGPIVAMEIKEAAG